MRNFRRLGILVLLLVVVVSAQRRRRDPLTDAEADQMREVAQEPEKRIKLVIKFAQARLQAIEQLRGDPKMAKGRGKQIHDLLEDFTTLVDELGDNVEMYARRKDDIHKAVGQVIATDSEFQLQLRALKDAAADPKTAQEAKDYEFALQNAIDAVDANLQDSRDLLQQIAKEKPEAKGAEKKKKDKD
ncbi:MAG TPA: hypothetical protein VMS96_02795 [Terriglobales bacterium]|nr:hypothetical protein [Terriglobales bacterium]